MNIRAGVKDRTETCSQVCARRENKDGAAIVSDQLKHLAKLFPGQ